ncbi:YceI family protein [Mariniluteicoccus endophyticus]
MTPMTGTYELGPDSGDLLLHTTCEGAMAKMGHDLTLVVDRWHGTLAVGETPADSSLRVTADLDSIRVRDSSGGAKPVSDSDRAQIEKNAQSSLGVAANPELAFTSTAVDGTWESGRVEGPLTLNGRSERQELAVTGDGTTFTLTGDISQKRFGIKPFSAMMGALRLGDTVAVEVTVELEG